MNSINDQLRLQIYKPGFKPNNTQYKTLYQPLTATLYWNLLHQINQQLMFT